jgi:hypothetical protein
MSSARLATEFLLGVQIRMKQELTETPRLYFTIGYGNGLNGRKYLLHLENQSDEPAYELSIYLPGLVGPALKTNYLSAKGKPENYPIPPTTNSSIRTQPQQGLTARLIYHNRFDKQFIYERELVQEKRADGLYNIISTYRVPVLTRSRKRTVKG